MDMRRFRQFIFRLGDKQGVTVVIVAVLIVVLLGFVALAVDIGYLMVARNELQNAADAAALAGARRMGQNYHDGVDQSTFCPENITSVAQNTASKNKAAGLNLAEDISAGNVVTSIGTWDPTKPPDQRFVKTCVYPNAVQVVAKREGGTTNGPIGTFFAPIFKLIDPSSPDTVNVGATACAALSGPCEEKPSIPLGIGRSWFENVGANRGCTQIAVNNTFKSCAGWTNLSSDPFKWKDADAMIVDPTKIPTMHYGDVAEFGNGTVEPLLVDLLALFDANKIPDATSPSGYSWTTSVLVFEDYNVCVPPTEGYKVLGFATVKIEDIITTGSDKGIYGKVQCGVAEEKRGGCYYAGTYGTIPGLVQ
jgi:Flp pilus assembly protein TadG